MKTALQELIEWAETPAMTHMENKSIMTKMKELLEKERQLIIVAHMNGFLESKLKGHYVSKYSTDYFNELQNHQER